MMSNLTFYVAFSKRAPDTTRMTFLCDIDGDGPRQLVRYGLIRVDDHRYEARIPIGFVSGGIKFELTWTGGPPNAQVQVLAYHDYPRERLVHDGHTRALGSVGYYEGVCT